MSLKLRFGRFAAARPNTAGQAEFSFRVASPIAAVATAQMPFFTARSGALGKCSTVADCQR